MKKGNMSVHDEEGWKGNSSKRNNSHDLYLQQPVYELTFKLVVNLEVGVLSSALTGCVRVGNYKHNLEIHACAKVKWLYAK